MKSSPSEPATLSEDAPACRRYRVVVATAMTVVCGHDCNHEDDEHDDITSLVDKWGERLISIEALHNGQ